jgi:hypothetical protein
MKAPLAAISGTLHHGKPAVQDQSRRSNQRSETLKTIGVPDERIKNDFFPVYQ